MPFEAPADSAAPLCTMVPLGNYIGTSKRATADGYKLASGPGDHRSQKRKEDLVELRQWVLSPHIETHRNEHRLLGDMGWWIVQAARRS